MKHWLTFRRWTALVVLWLGAPLAVLAQPALPNPSFETWRSQTIQTVLGPRTIQLPQSWDIGQVSAFTTAFGLPFRVDRSTISHSGAASVRMTVGPDSAGGDIQTRLAVTSGALGVEAWVRSSAVVPDTQAGFAVVIFTRTRPGGGTDTVAFGGGPLVNQTPNQWERVVYPVIPLRPVTPDSVLVWLLSFGSPPGHEVWVDDVRLINTFPTATPPEEPAARPLTLSPNPVAAQTGATLHVSSRHGGPAVLAVTDVLGRAAGRVRVVQLTAGDNEIALPIKDLPAGAYAVRLNSADGPRYGRLVIE